MDLYLTDSTPEANPIVRKVAEIFHSQFGSGLLCITLHGSAYKGGFIPGSSDIDFQIYLEESLFNASGQLSLELCLTIHKELSAIDPYPFRYIQIRAMSLNLPAGYIGPIPGTYQLVYGRLPLKEATSYEIIDMAKQALTNLCPEPHYLTEGLLEHGGNRMARIVRLLCTEVSPALYHYLTIYSEDVMVIWGLPKHEAIGLLSTAPPELKQTIEQFYTSVRAYYPSEESVELALDIIRNGTLFLKLVKNSWEI